MRNYFYGWYFKCQSETQTFAVIPAVHTTNKKRSCSIQIIMDENAWTFPLTEELFCHKGKNIRIGRNCFGESGIQLEIAMPEISICGKLDFGLLFPLKYDIMGPFVLMPWMECRHGVWSMRHIVQGSVDINGREYLFRNALGYWEGDRGYSFPREYLWTQCFFSEGSLMLSAAEIPLGRVRFIGIIGFVLWRGKEYRIATYLGARVTLLKDKMVCIRQGKMELTAQLLESSGHSLKAPVKGNMVRTIHESVSCRAYYCFRKNECIFFEFETERASFEYEFSL